jgi:hypothetical protein
MSDLQKDLAEIQRSCTSWIGTVAANGSMAGPAVQAINEMFRVHHATIQQNAEAALRLRALERAVFFEDDEIEDRIERRAKQILREWKESK